MSKNKKSSSKKKNHKLLKKIGIFLINVIEAIAKVIDKIIITPISKLMLLIIDLFKSNNKPFDRLLNNKSFLIVFSLILAFGTFIYIEKTADTTRNKSADILSNQKVNALYNEEAYVVEGLPDTVDVMLIGRKSNLYLAKQQLTLNDSVVVDLRNLKPGTHEVELKYSKMFSSVDYKLDPSKVTVVIYEKMSESINISSEIMNEKYLDSKFNISNITFSRDEVYIKGPKYKLDQVAVVKALIDVSKIVNPSVGTTTLKDVPLVAYDVNGTKLDIEIVPETIDVTMSITSPSKEVPLKVIPEGEVAFGKSLDSITLSQSKVTIYGDEEILKNINSIPVKINVEKLDKNTEYNVNLSKPSGVKEMSISTVVVKVTLTSTSEKTIDGVLIETRNLENGYVAQAASASDSTVSVIVKGTTSNLNNVTKDNINAYVDLKGLGVGTHTVNVNVTGDDVKLSYTPKTTTVTIVINKK